MLETYSKTIIDMKGRFKVHPGWTSDDQRTLFVRKEEETVRDAASLFRIMSRTYSKAYLLLKESKRGDDNLFLTHVWQFLAGTRAW